MAALEVGALRDDERTPVASLAARALCANPLERAAGGRDAARRERALAAFFRTFFALAPAAPLVARRAGLPVGVAGAAPPGLCLLPASHVLRLLPPLLRFGPRACARRLRCMAAWAERDPQEPHWHVGPVAVEPALQGGGIGTRLMERLCARADASGADAWLETDRAENVRFYERLGFETAEQVRVLGIPTWLMRRRA